VKRVLILKKAEGKENVLSSLKIIKTIIIKIPLSVLIRVYQASIVIQII